MNYPVGPELLLEPEMTNGVISARHCVNKSL